MDANTDWEDLPTYFELINSIRNFVVYSYQESLVKKNESRQAECTWRFCNITTYDVTFVILLAIMWTVLRHLASEKISKPLAQYYALTPTNQRKVPESAWKFLYYFCVWSYSLYVVALSGRYTFYQKPSTVWVGWNLEDDLPTDIYLIYTVQCGFYVHALYTTVFLDTWKKDFLIMVIHHVLTLLLIFISYTFRCHNVGTLVFLAHDVTDVLMEFSKINVYFKIQNGKLVRIHELISNAIVPVFTVVWFVSRLYYHPLKAMYAMTYHVQHMQLKIPCVLLLNSILWIHQILNIYWSVLILLFLYRVATNQVHKENDKRKYDLEEKFKLSINSSSCAIGNTKSNGDEDDAVIAKGDTKIRSKKAD